MRQLGDWGYLAYLKGINLDAKFSTGSPDAAVGLHSVVEGLHQSRPVCLLEVLRLVTVT